MDNCIYVKEGQEGIYEEKKSRFIAKVYPVSDETEVTAFLEAARKKYYDARHNCYAYVIGKNNGFIKCSDDGEPQGTAGKPILEVIQGAEIHNCLIIVTRYFGGTLLGTGGLIRAYTKASKDAVMASRFVNMVDGERYLIQTDYNSINKIQRIAADLNASICNAKYAEDVQLNILIAKNKGTEICTLVSEATCGKAIMLHENDELIEEPIELF